jgi:hypothetical protein
MRTRGFVRTSEVAPVPGAPGQFAVEVHLTDAANVEQYVHWKGTHFLGGAPARAVEIEHGDDIEVHLDVAEKGGYTKESYVHNHTRGVRYTFVQRRTGCLGILAALAAVATLAAGAGIWALA